jgi:hypothetical protein
MTMRIESCVCCGTPFILTPRHPGIESSWCDACLAVLREMMMLEVEQVGPVDALRAEAV